MQVTELWRAAGSDRHAELIATFGDPVLVEAANIAGRANKPTRAAETFDNALDRDAKSGVLFDCARRALVRAVANDAGAAGFGSELFVEAANYYVSRDLPSFVGQAGRVPSASAALELKNDIREYTREAVRAVASSLKSGKVATDQWNAFIEDALNALRRRPRK
jgi:predicted Zn-dependent protease